MNKNQVLKLSLIVIIAFSIMSASLIFQDNLSASDNAPKGYSNYYIRGVCFNVPDSYKLVDEGWDDVNKVNYANFKNGKNFINITLDKHSSEFNKNIMDGFSSFTINGIKLNKKTISHITGFYAKKNGVKHFVFATSDDFAYVAVKGPKLSNVLSSTKQFDYKAYHNDEYDFDDDAYYESDAYDDSFDDSFDDASYYNYGW